MKNLLADKKIFMVEDHSGNMAIVKTLLETSGATVKFDRWGTEVIPKAQTFLPIDLILLDLMYPRNITGYDIYDQIREFNDFDGVPIVAVSASEPSVAIPKTRQKGFNGFIAKPIEIELFPAQIQKILAGESVWFAGNHKIR